MISPKDFIDKAAARFGSTLEEITNKKRHFRIVRFRVAIAQILRKNMGLSLEEIANYMNRDHTTILFYMRKFETNKENIEPLVELIKNIPNEVDYEQHIQL